MNTKLFKLPFRIGTSSYIIPADILPNVRFLCDKVRDIELVFFESGEFSNLPDEPLVLELASIASAFGLTYTVHLPLDLDNSNTSYEKIMQVINTTNFLAPWSYVLHLDAHHFDQQEPTVWIQQNITMLKRIKRAAGANCPIAVENLESYSAELNHPVIDACESWQCVDVGHLWLQQRDPLDLLEDRLDKTRVIHLHGIGTRDHQSLNLMPLPQVRRLVQYLIQKEYDGVVTLEIFSEEDLFTSLEVLERCL